MIHRLLSTVLVILAAFTLLAATVPNMLLVAQDNHDRPLKDFRFAHEGRPTLPTIDTGATELELPPPGKEPGEKIKLLLLATPKDDPDWFLVTPSVNVPKPQTSADVVLMRKSDFREFAERGLDSTCVGVGWTSCSSRRKQRILRQAEGYGLSPEELESGLQSFAETQDPDDRELAAQLRRNLEGGGKLRLSP